MKKVRLIQMYFLYLMITFTVASIPSFTGDVEEDPSILTPPIIEEAYEVSIDEHITQEAIKYDVDPFLAKKIMWCESRQYENKAINENKRDDGSVWSLDIGRWQINDYWHQETMKSMGWDIYDDHDNVSYGFYLLNKEGTRHWNASKHCWKHEKPWEIYK